MPEGNVNAEIAHHLGEHGPRGAGDGRTRRQIEVVEILEAVLLAIVALATAVSGLEAARWDGESARAYATSSRLRVESQAAQLSSNQTLLYNTGTLNSWLQATSSGDKKLARLLAARFTPNYAAAFKDWLKLHPLTNAHAPVGPRFMPGYKDPLRAQAAQLGNQATAEFTAGVEDRVTAEEYVRVTVILAAVLFIIAIGQRFTLRKVRIGLNTVAGMFLLYCFILLLIYPHA
jgi:hypothetical protein